MATHEQWLKAKDKRDRAALQAVHHLTRGNIDSAKEEAFKSEAFEADMIRIAKELDK